MAYKTSKRTSGSPPLTGFPFTKRRLIVDCPRRLEYVFSHEVTHKFVFSRWMHRSCLSAKDRETRATSTTTTRSRCASRQQKSAVASSPTSNNCFLQRSSHHRQHHHLVTRHLISFTHSTAPDILTSSRPRSHRAANSRSVFLTDRKSVV